LGDGITNLCFIKAAGMKYNRGKCAVKFIDYIFLGCSNEGGRDGPCILHALEREEKCVKLLFRTSERRCP
jgi:hypothetical protein